MTIRNTRIVDQGKNEKISVFLLVIGKEKGLLFLSVTLVYTWTYSLFKRERLSIVVLLLGINLFFSLASLVVQPRKSVFALCRYGLQLNNEEILYAGSTSAGVKKGCS